MKKEELEELIRKYDKNKVIFSYHYTKEREDVRFLKEEVLETLFSKNILNFKEKEGNTIKLWLEFDEKHDMVIILRIFQDKIKIITAYPQRIERRQK